VASHTQTRFRVLRRKMGPAERSVAKISSPCKAGCDTRNKARGVAPQARIGSLRRGDIVRSDDSRPHSAPAAPQQRFAQSLSHSDNCARVGDAVY